MLHRTIAAGLMFALLAGPGHAASAEPVPLEPTTQWRIDYGEERCSLLRQFGDRKDGVLLEIASFGSRISFRTTLIGKPVPRAASASGNASLRFIPDTIDRDISTLSGTVTDKVPAVLFTAQFIAFDEVRERFSNKPPSKEKMDFDAMPDRPEPEFEEQTTGLLVKLSGKGQIALHTGRMAKPLAAMRSCVDSLETSWGLDPATEQTLSRRVVPLPSTVKMIMGNYPSSMIANGLSAYVPVRIMVDAEGNAGTCVVQADNVDAAFQKAVCNGLAKRFQPALDAQGKPVASVFATTVIFRIN